MTPRHTHLIGAREQDRLAAAGIDEDRDVFARCHRRLRGPYSGVDTVLARVLPDAHRRWPELVAYHRFELLDGMPHFAGIVGPVPHTYANEAPFEERTRWYNQMMVRCMSQGIVTFLREYASRVRESGGTLPVLFFDGVHEADHTAREFVALFLRRIEPGLWPVIVGSTGEVPAELGQALTAYAVRRDASAGPGRAPSGDLAAAYVDSDGTLDDPAALAAYTALAPEVRAALHDHRAEELETSDAHTGLLVGSLPYHRSRGSDPSRAGVAAILSAAQYGNMRGFSAMVIELSEQGRELIDPDADPDSYRKLTMLQATQLAGLLQLEKPVELCHELRRRYADPLAHMVTSYLMAMICTRFAVPRDHEQAVEWENNAIAIASQLTDRKQQLLLTGFQENGMALIEMHRGNLDRALELVNGVIGRLNRELEPDDWPLHRSQLFYNQTRLLAAKQRYEEAYGGFTTLIEMDPHYTEYLSERAKISYRRGDLDAALTDYQRAVEIGPPFPEVFRNRGSIHAERGETAAALADFDLVLDMEPDDTEARLYRANLLFDAGDTLRARADVEHALRIVADEPRTRFLRGMILLGDGEPAAALADFDAVLAQDSANPAALVNRANALFELGQPDSSVADLTQAMEILGEDPDLLLNRGIALAGCGRPDEAMADFDHALTLPDCDVAELRFQRGAVLVERGQAAAAEADLRLVLSLQPEHPQVPELLTRNGTPLLAAR